MFVAVQVLGGGGGGGSGGFAIDQPFGDVAGSPAGEAPIPASQDPDRDLRDFSAYVFTDAQDRWVAAFDREGRPYRRAKLVLYRDAVLTEGCGGASSAIGPFYCPADRRVYLDLSFYRDMTRRLRASGDFAWAYVIAHEMGHHVQNELGTAAQVERARREDPDRANELSVRQELQADCYAGVWAHEVYRAGQLEPGDVEEAFRASEAVGDDRLQRNAGRQIDPDAFTHGTSAQRRRWFDAGRRSGDPADCDTFAVEEP
ncbi:MAG TPA: neutral zinc metallopeptidase [Solirubrobacteraceae bacterium]|nr:neutral zinc metallopeptidase [Solirubrobacteraceae bacterium]